MCVTESVVTATTDTLMENVHVVRVKLSENFTHLHLSCTCVLKSKIEDKSWPLGRQFLYIVNRNQNMEMKYVI